MCFFNTLLFIVIGHKRGNLKMINAEIAQMLAELKEVGNRYNEVELAMRYSTGNIGGR
jgi:hypothetical protein